MSQKKFQNLLRNKQTFIIVYSVILTQESSVNSDKFMTFQLLSYSVLHQPRYDNTHMFVIPSKVRHNNSMRGSINFQLKKVNKYLKLISCTIENEILNITNMILVSILFLYIYIYIYVYIYIFLTKKFMVPRLILNPILFQFYFFQMLSCLPWKK